MKFFHLSDIHIGLKLYNYDLSEEQRYVFGQIRDAAEKEKPEAVVIAGDVFDKSVPSAEAVGLFDEFLTQLAGAVPEAEIMVISGNHDSAQRVNLYRSILARHNIHMIGLPPSTPGEKIEKVTLTDAFGKVNFYLLPFVKPSMVKEIVGTDSDGVNLSYDESVRRLIGGEEIDETQRNVLVSHQFYLSPGTAACDVERMKSEICTVGNIDQVNAEILERFDYAALGHIHKPMKVGKSRFRYCGTPVPCSLTEEGQEKAVIVVEMNEKGSTEIRTLPLRQLRNIRTVSGTKEEILSQSSDDYVRIVFTDTESGDADLQDRTRSLYPHLLETNFALSRGTDYSVELPEGREMDVYELCLHFLKDDVTPDEREIIRDIINHVQEGQI